MELSTDQLRALEMVRLEIEPTYPLIDETFREGWEAPGIADYDRYDELKQQCK